MYPTLGVSHGKGAVKPQESVVFIPNRRDRRAYPGSTTRREVSTTVADQGEGSGGPPLTYFRPNWGPKGQKNLFYKSPPLSQGLDDRFPTPPPHLIQRLYHLNKYTIIYPFLHWKIAEFAFFIDLPIFQG